MAAVGMGNDLFRASETQRETQRETHPAMSDAWHKVLPWGPLHSRFAAVIRQAGLGPLRYTEISVRGYGGNEARFGSLYMGS